MLAKYTISLRSSASTSDQLDVESHVAVNRKIGLFDLLVAILAEPGQPAAVSEAVNLIEAVPVSPRFVPPPRFLVEAIHAGVLDRRQPRPGCSRHDTGECV